MHGRSDAAIGAYPATALASLQDWSHARVLVPQASWRGYRSGVRLSVDAEEGQPGPSLPQANSDLGFDAPPPAGRTKQDVWDRMRMYRCLRRARALHSLACLSAAMSEQCLAHPPTSPMM